MAAQYSNRHFFRKTPNLYLAAFFEASHIPLGIDFDKLAESDIDVIQTALMLCQLIK